VDPRCDPAGDARRIPASPVQAIEARLEEIVVTEGLAMRLLAWFAVAALAPSLIWRSRPHCTARDVAFAHDAFRLALGARPRT